MGELALGTLRQRELVLESLCDLPQAVVASHEEVFTFIERHALAGSGIGLVDVHLLASARLSSGSLLTRDKRLSAAARQLGLDSPS